MDLIDLRSIADGDFKYLLNYIDHCTKYLVCIPLKSKTARVVAQALVQIFTIIGPPKILQTDNGGEFVGVAYTDKEIRCMQLDDAVRLPTFSYIFSYIEYWFLSNI
jgi:transposase InsO family protein